MVLSSLILFFCTLGGGMIYVLFPAIRKEYNLPLVFVGSYLFAITIIHLIPELFAVSNEPTTIGLYILLGFFLQQFLEYFSSGIEHGHFHVEHGLTKGSRFSLIIALIIHSLLEGSVLTHDSPFHDQHESYSLLLGIVLHKVPAAFALMVTMRELNRTTYLILVIFSLASPLGIWFGNLLFVSGQLYTIIFAIVCGSFLHISTTIFVETSPNHSFGIKKIMISVLGALLAILIENII